MELLQHLRVHKRICAVDADFAGDVYSLFEPIEPVELVERAVLLIQEWNISFWTLRCH